MKDIFQFVTIIDPSERKFLSNGILENKGIGFKLEDFNRNNSVFQNIIEWPPHDGKISYQINDVEYNRLKTVFDELEKKEIEKNYMNEIKLNLFGFYRLLRKYIKHHSYMVNIVNRDYILSLKSDLNRCSTALNKCQKIGINIENGVFINMRVFGNVDKNRKGRWYKLPESVLGTVRDNMLIRAKNKGEPFFKDETVYLEYISGDTFLKIKEQLNESIKVLSWMKGIKVSNKEEEANDRIRNTANLRLISKVNALYRFIKDNKFVVELLMSEANKTNSNKEIIAKFIHSFLNIEISEEVLINSLGRRSNGKTEFEIDT